MLSLLLILLMMTSVVNGLNGDHYLIYVYGDIHCPHCATLKEFIVKNYGEEHLYFCDVGANRTCTLKFYNIVQTFGIQPGIPLSAVIVNGKATGVVLGELPVKSIWDKLIKPANLGSHIPIYAITSNGTPTIIGYLEISQEDLAYLFVHGELPATNTTTTTTNKTNTPSTGMITATQTTISTTSTTTRTQTTVSLTKSAVSRVETNNTSISSITSSTKAFANRQVASKNNSTMAQTSTTETVKTALSNNTSTANLVRPLTSRSRSMNFLTALSLTISLSLADSVNPCTIYLYTILLIAASIASIGVEKKVNYRRVIAVGLAFALAVLLGYLLLGLGLITFASNIPKIFFTSVGVGFGLWIIYSALTGRERVTAKKSMVKLLPKASKNILLSFSLGLLATFTLLPCSAGPYIVFAGIASKLLLIQAATLLLIYNLVFISPLIIVLMAILLGVSRQGIRDFLVRHNRILSIVAGILLIIVAIYASLT